MKHSERSMEEAEQTHEEAVPQSALLKLEFFQPEFPPLFDLDPKFHKLYLGQCLHYLWFVLHICHLF